MRNNINVSITVTPRLKKVLDAIVGRDSHISYGDFFRESARVNLRRNYPRYARSLGLKPEKVGRPTPSRDIDGAGREKKGGVN